MANRSSANIKELEDMRNIFATRSATGDFPKRKQATMSASTAYRKTIEVLRKNASISWKNTFQYPQKSMNTIPAEVKLRITSQKINEDSRLTHS